jgi:hypothetical protein
VPGLDQGQYRGATGAQRQLKQIITEALRRVLLAAIAAHADPIASTVREASLLNGPFRLQSGD